MTQQLVIDHVSKVFGGLKAVADVTMTIEQGTLIALIGPNGAGKTTLFNMLTGESGPSSGTITLYTRSQLFHSRYRGPELQPHIW